LKIKSGLLHPTAPPRPSTALRNPIRIPQHLPPAVLEAVHSHFATELSRATPHKLSTPPWELPDNPDNFTIEPRGDPSLTFADMIPRDTFDKPLNSLGTGKAPGPDGIPNEIIKFLPPVTRSALFSLLSLLAHKSYTPPEWCHSTTCLLHKKGDPTLLDNYRPIALMNILLKLWTALIKDAGSKYAETHGILIDQQHGFRQHRSIHDAMTSIIMTMEDAKFHNKDIYVMYADFKCAFSAADHRIMFKHM
jgi:hypothetical protein